MLPRAYARAYCTKGIPCHQPRSAKPLTRAVEHMGQQGQGVGSVQVSPGGGDSKQKAGSQMDGEQSRARSSAEPTAFTRKTRRRFRSWKSGPHTPFQKPANTVINVCIYQTPVCTQNRVRDNRELFKQTRSLPSRC